MKKIYETVFKYGEADRLRGEPTKIRSIIIVLCLISFHDMADYPLHESN
jgi:hypothetical protein